MPRVSPTSSSSRLFAACLSALLASLPLAAAAQQAPASKQFPDAPAPAGRALQAETAMAGPPAVPVPEGWSSSQAQQASAPDADQQQNQPQKPVGTAAGPVTQPVGIAGARPSGAAIAPAKQRRVRAFFIRVSIILAAAGATGAVIGLSHASPSHPQ